MVELSEYPLYATHGRGLGEFIEGMTGKERACRG